MLTQAALLYNLAAYKLLAISRMPPYATRVRRLRHIDMQHCVVGQANYRLRTPGIICTHWNATHDEWEVYDGKADALCVGEGLHEQPDNTQQSRRVEQRYEPPESHTLCHSSTRNMGAVRRMTRQAAIRRVVKSLELPGRRSCDVR